MKSQFHETVMVRPSYKIGRPLFHQSTKNPQTNLPKYVMGSPRRFYVGKDELTLTVAPMTKAFSHHKPIFYFDLH
jgi:hypothetical protein